MKWQSIIFLIMPRGLPLLQFNTLQRFQIFDRFKKTAEYKIVKEGLVSRDELPYQY